MKFKDLNLLDVGHKIQLVGAVYAEGDEFCLVCPFPDETVPKDFVNFLEMDAAEWQLFLRQSDLLEVEAQVTNADGSIEKAIVRKSQRQVEQGVSWRCFRRDEYRCRYCAADDVPLTVDHLVRWEEGGPSTEANMVSACRKCNRVRGDLPYADWLKSRRYLDLSRRLTETVRQANEALVATLDAVPRVPVRSRR